MAMRPRKRSTRLALPWEREDSVLRSLFSGRRLLPFVVLFVGTCLLGGAHWFGGRRADVLATRATLGEVSSAVDAFIRDIGRCPRSLNELVHPPRSGAHYLHEVPLDAWGQGFFLRCENGAPPAIEVISAGPDGSFLDADNLL